jgi:hypothetical protein
VMNDLVLHTSPVPACRNEEERGQGRREGGGRFCWSDNHLFGVTRYYSHALMMMRGPQMLSPCVTRVRFRPCVAGAADGADDVPLPPPPSHGKAPEGEEIVITITLMWVSAAGARYLCAACVCTTKSFCMVVRYLCAAEVCSTKSFLI